MSWVEPRDVRDWLRRVFALRPILLTLLISSIIILEMRFDWIERSIGAYLVTTNPNRPEYGAIWEKGHQALAARKTLEKIVTDRQVSQREARNASTLSTMAAGMAPGDGVMLSAERFRQLYLRLPPSISQEIMSPYDLLRIASGGRWRRTYFEKAVTGLAVYLLDADNHVLFQIDMPSKVLKQLKREDAAPVETLEDLSNFEQRIYTAERFFEALKAFPEETRRNMLPHPEKLLQLSGRIVRVGISDEAVSGFIDLGFEVHDGSLPRVVLIPGHEWAVWRLRSFLEERGTSLNLSAESPQNRLSK